MRRCPRGLVVALVGLVSVVGVAPPAAAAARRQSVPQRSFNIAVIPDTQLETVSAGDPRLRNRNRWLVNRRAALDLRFVAQSGDLTNWGWLAPEQLTRASRAFALLEEAGLPYSIAVGNHDTRGVGWDHNGGYGGAPYVLNPECVERFSPEVCQMSVLVRHTEEINAVFDADRFGNVRGAFEPGKIDNLYSTFQAEGYTWLVLDLELWPRPEVVDWANDVVRDHPDANVMVNMHSYLTGRGALDKSAYDGITTPRQLWRQFISRHENISLVTCGHVGKARVRVDRGVEGNKVVTLLTAMHSADSNPLRLVQVDPRAGVIRTRVLAPFTDQRFPRFTAKVDGLRFVR